MPEKTPTKIVDEFTEMIPTLTEALNMPAAFTGLVGAILNSIPDEQWQRTMHLAQSPCGTIGCRCHIRMANLYVKIDEIRDEAKERAAGRR